MNGGERYRALSWFVAGHLTASGPAPTLDTVPDTGDGAGPEVEL